MWPSRRVPARRGSQTWSICISSTCCTGSWPGSLGAVGGGQHLPSICRQWGYDPPHRPTRSSFRRLRAEDDPSIGNRPERRNINLRINGYDANPDAASSETVNNVRRAKIGGCALFERNGDGRSPPDEENGASFFTPPRVHRLYFVCLVNA